MEPNLLCRDPRTGKRVARVNRPEDREITAVPQLRIVDDTLWARVKARQGEVRIEMGKDEDGRALNSTHRRRFLLSGLLRCGCCGGAYTIITADRYGCTTRQAKGTCMNTVTIARQAVEARVLGGLKDHLLAPDLIEKFVRAYHEQINRAHREAASASEALRREQKGVSRKIAGIAGSGSRAGSGAACTRSSPRSIARKWRIWRSP